MNPEKDREKVRKKKDFLKTWIRGYKASLKCEVCGEGRWQVLDFHHRVPADKGFEISKITSKMCSLSRIKVELDKCMVLCANCHRMVHWKEKEIPGVREKREEKQMELV